eukprot:gene3326-6581_t
MASRVPLQSIENSNATGDRLSLTKPNFFKDTLAKCGIFLACDDGFSFYITCHEPTRSLKQLESALRLQSHRLGEFCDLMEVYLGNYERLAHALSPMTTEFDALQSLHLFCQSPSLLKLLMQIESIQSNLTRFLIQRLLNLTSSASSLADNVSDIPINIINHIRWCDILYDSHVTLGLLLQAVEVLPQPLQIEIISAIPALVNDSESEEVVSQLLQLEDSCPELIPSVLEAVGNLALPAESQALNSVLMHTLQLLSSSPPHMLPSVTKFLLQSTCPSNVEMIFTEIRERLTDFLLSIDEDNNDHINITTQNNNNHNNNNSNSNILMNSTEIYERKKQKEIIQTTQTLLINILKTAFHGEEFLSTTVLQSIETAAVLTPIDIWLSFILIGDIRFKSKICLLLTKKSYEDISNNNNNNNTATNNKQCNLNVNLNLALKNKSSALETLFPNILTMAQYCLSCNRIGSIAAQSRQFATKLYYEIYFEFKNHPQYRQDIVASLITHVTSPSSKEIDCALSILGQIAQKEQIEYLNKYKVALSTSNSSSTASRYSSRYSYVTLRTFSSFIKSLLEDITSLTENQQRILFRIASSYLNLNDNSNSNDNSNDNNNGSETQTNSISTDESTNFSQVDIDSNKNNSQILSSSLSTSQQRHHLTTSSSQTQFHTKDNYSSNNSSSNYSSHNNNSAMFMLETLLHTVSDDQSCALRSFLLDELTTTIEQSKIKNDGIIKALSKAIEEELYTFLGPDENENEPYGNSTSTSTSMQMLLEHQYDLNGDKSDLFAAEGGKLTSILVLLGAPLELPAPDALERYVAGSSGGGVVGVSSRSKVKHVICASLHFAVDWIREILNAFCTPWSWESETPSDKTKTAATQLSISPRLHLLKRFHVLVELEDELYSQTQRYPEYFETIASEYDFSKNMKSKGKTASTTATTGSSSTVGSQSTTRSKTQTTTTGSSSRAKKDGRKLMLGAEGFKTLDLSVDEVAAVYKTVLRQVDLALLLLITLLVVGTVLPLQSHVCQLLGLGLLPRAGVCDRRSVGNMQDSNNSNDSQCQYETELESSSSLLSMQKSTKTSLRLLSHTVDCLKNLQHSTEHIGESSSNIFESSPLYVLLLQLQKVGTFKALYFLLHRVNKALLNSSSSNTQSQSQCVPSQGQRQSQRRQGKSSVTVTNVSGVHMVEPSELLMDRPDLMPSELLMDRPDLMVADTLFGETNGDNDGEDDEDDDPYDILPSLSHAIMIITTVISSEELIQGAMKSKSSILHDGTEDIEDEVEEDQDIGLMGQSSSPSAVSRPLLLSILHDLSGLNAATSPGTTKLKLKLPHTQTSDRHHLITFLNMCFSITTRLTEAPMLEHAVALVQLLDHSLTLLGALSTLHDNNSDDHDNDSISVYSTRLSNLCDQLLRVNWVDTLNNRRYGAKDVGILVKMNLKWASDAIERCHVVATDILSRVILDQVMDDDNVDRLQEYPTLTTASFVCFYNPLFDVIVDCWVMFTKVEVDDNELLEHTSHNMSRLVLVFGELLSFTKGQPNLDKRIIFTTALRKGRRFVEAFLKSTKILQRLFSLSLDGQRRTIALVSSLQKSTRQLQILCSHAKLMRDKNLSQEAPHIKKLLEQVIYRMKALLEDNNCAGAFWVGNLKHRRLDGTELGDEQEDEEERLRRNNKGTKRKSAVDNNKKKRSKKVKNEDQNDDVDVEVGQRMHGEDQEEREDQEEEEEYEDEEYNETEDAAAEKVIDSWTDDDDEDEVNKDDNNNDNDEEDDNDEDEEDEVATRRKSKLVNNKAVSIKGKSPD